MLSPVCKSYRTKFKLDIRLYAQDFGLMLAFIHGRKIKPMLEGMIKILDKSWSMVELMEDVEVIERVLKEFVREKLELATKFGDQRTRWIKGVLWSHGKYELTCCVCDFKMKDECGEDLRLASFVILTSFIDDLDGKVVEIVYFWETYSSFPPDYELLPSYSSDPESLSSYSSDPKSLSSYCSDPESFPSSSLPEISCDFLSRTSRFLTLANVVSWDAITIPRICGARPHMYRSIFLYSGVTIPGHSTASSAFTSEPSIVRFQNSCSNFCTSLLGQYSFNIMVYRSSHDIELAATMPIVWTCPFHQDRAASMKVQAPNFTWSSDRFRLLKPSSQLDDAPVSEKELGFTIHEILVGAWSRVVTPPNQDLAETSGGWYLEFSKPSDHGPLRDGETQTRASHRVSHCPKDYVPPGDLDTGRLEWVFRVWFSGSVPAKEKERCEKCVAVRVLLFHLILALPGKLWSVLSAPSNLHDRDSTLFQPFDFLIHDLNWFFHEVQFFVDLDLF
ncbi:hypothetical protein LXL04_020616 [Taraxacum kok-saghyz]